MVGFESELFLWLVPSNRLLRHTPMPDLSDGPSLRRAETHDKDLSWASRRNAARDQVTDLVGRARISDKVARQDDGDGSRA